MAAWCTKSLPDGERAGRHTGEIAGARSGVLGADGREVLVDFEIPIGADAPIAVADTPPAGGRCSRR